MDDEELFGEEDEDEDGAFVMYAFTFFFHSSINLLVLVGVVSQKLSGTIS